MSSTLQKGKLSLRRRARRFLTTDLYGRKEVSVFCDEIGSIGDVAIFGGMLRDLLLDGNEKFCSDVDLVIDTDDIGSLESALMRFSPHRTAFGGYRIRLQRWSLDLWPLKWTWAIRHGYVQGESLSDLIRTTFFNWDAVVYELRSGTIHCSPTYVEELSDRFLTINFAENPNPEGAAIRALRMAVAKRAKLSFELAEYAADVLETVGIEAIIRAEQTRHKAARVSPSVMADFLDEFNRCKAECRTDPIALRDRQIAFAFASESAVLNARPSTSATEDERL